MIREGETSTPRPIDLKPRDMLIGSRGSKLALWQAHWIKEQIEERFPQRKVFIEIIRTTGDKLSDAALSATGVKGLFIKEIEEALLEGKIDLAVHSLKDMPIELPPGLTISAVTQREDARDALVTKGAIKRFNDLPIGAVVGTSSLRRQAQIKHLRPDIQVINLRGNVDTRLKKLETAELQAVVLATAGLLRLGFENRIAEIFSPDVLMPAIGQGALAIETRRDDHQVEEFVSFLHDPSTDTEVKAERALLRHLGGGCQAPIAGYAELQDKVLSLSGLIGSPDGKSLIKDKMSSRSSTPDELGRRLAEKLLSSGGREILKMIYDK